MEVRSEKPKRNKAVNRLKMVSVIAVFLIHCQFPGVTGEAARGLASFAVPVFFMIAGCYSYPLRPESLKRKSFSALKLLFYANLFYAVWDMFYLWVQGETVGAWFRANLQFKRIAVFLLFNESPFRGHLWFLGALFYSYLFMLAAVGLKMDKWWKGRFLYLPAVLLLLGNLVLGELFTAMGHNIQIPYVRNWIFCGIPCFLLGYLLRVRKEEGKAPVLSNSIGKAVFVALVLAGTGEACLIPDSELYVSTVLIAGLCFQRVLYDCGKAEEGSGGWSVTAFVDKNAGLLYVLQVAVIKTVEWVQQEMGIGEKAVIRWTNPPVAILLTFFLTAILTKAFECLQRGLAQRRQD